MLESLVWTQSQDLAQGIPVMTSNSEYVTIYSSNFKGGEEKGVKKKFFALEHFKTTC